MKKIILVGRSGAGRTTLTQAVKGRRITYHKTQYINNHNVIVDTPGEYAEDKTLTKALVLYSYKVGVVELLTSAIEDCSLYSSHTVSMVTGGVVGIVTQINQSDTRPDLATIWLELTDCEKIFYVSSVTGKGVGDTPDYPREEGDVMPQEREKKTDEMSVDIGR